MRSQKTALLTIPNNQKSSKKQGFKPKLSNKYWWSDECQKAVDERKCALKQYTKNNTADNFIVYKTKRNKASAVITKTKKEAWRNFINNINVQDNPKQAWNQINGIRGIKHASKSNTPLVDTKNSTTAIGDNEKAELLSRTFAFISSDENLDPEFKKYKEKFSKENAKIFAKDENKHTTDYYNKPLTLKEFQSALDSKKKTSPGEDAITYEMINQTPLSFKLKILHLFNIIWSTGDVPQKFKHAVVVPIYKPGKDKKGPLSYIPISLTSHLGKLLKR